MKKLFPLLLFVFISFPSAQAKSRYTLQSPDKNISIHVLLTAQKTVCYTIEYTGTAIIEESKLGLIREDCDFSRDLALDSVSRMKEVTDHYKILSRVCAYNANRQIFHFSTPSGNKIDIIFQVSNDGAAFRYSFPDSSRKVFSIKKEITSFYFLHGTRTWIQPMAEAKSGWCQVNPSYEEHYQQNVEVGKLMAHKPGWVFPALFQYDKYWMLITETAPNRNYCGCRLLHDSSSSEMVIGFPDPRECFPGEPVNPESTLPWSTPWRIIAIGNNLKTIAESTLGTDLAEPNVLGDISYVKPGRASWSWPMLKDDSTIASVQKRFIDYASDMKWEYCLIDANWDTMIGYEKAKELADYARQKNVGILLWYNSSGDWNSTTYHPKSKLLTHESRLKEFTRLKEMGIKEIKVDFFGGDGQSMMAYYQDILEDAATFGLMVNCHGSTFPRGWHRTYPNLITMEGVKGFEFITFDQYNAEQEANHCCVLPFTRNLYDPMDFTPMAFSEIPNIKRKTTNGFELALSVVFWSGIQHYAEIPEGMAAIPEYVKEFLRGMPPSWEETRFIDGFPGKLVVLARRTGTTWYVAGINGEQIEKQVRVTLPFLTKPATGIQISDGSTDRSFTMTPITYTREQPFIITVKGNGGFVLKFSE
ncbi:MAG: glycoside hydrolase family 97 protein [Ignavibacteriae bacterium]|nr:MAG: glycoside hydrolase family 97 protein [Ignavibacteriota bacterium]